MALRSLLYMFTLKNQKHFADFAGNMFAQYRFVGGDGMQCSSGEIPRTITT